MSIETLLDELADRIKQDTDDDECRDEDPNTIDPTNECDACRGTVYPESATIYLCRSHYDELASRPKPTA